MSIQNFRELLILELQELFDSENQFLKGLSQWEISTSNQELKQLLKKFLQDSKEQAIRLKKSLQFLESNEGKEQSKAIKSLLLDLEENSKKFKDPILKEAWLIGALQKLKHFSIASYGTALAHAKLLGHDEIEELLDKTLQEKLTADKKLSKIAEGSFFSDGINAEALHKSHR